MRVMIALPDVRELESLALFVGVLVGGLGFALGQWRRGRSDQTASVLAIATDEIDVLKGARERMRADLDEAVGKIANLEKIAGELARENASLRELVMLDAVPPALQDAISQGAGDATEFAARLHEETRARIIAELGAAERRIVALLER